MGILGKIIPLFFINGFSLFFFWLMNYFSGLLQFIVASNFINVTIFFI